jgi:hypothetical protein
MLQLQKANHNINYLLQSQVLPAHPHICNNNLENLTHVIWTPDRKGENNSKKQGVWTQNLHDACILSSHKYSSGFQNLK